MRGFASTTFAFLFVVASCSSSHRVGDPGDGGPPGDFPDSGDWTDGGQWWPDAEPQDVGPACPDAGGIITAYHCDIIEQDCPPDLACYGFVEYVDDPCIREVYRSECLAPGSGRQGDSCDDWCQAGFECFVTGEGTQCLAICDILGGVRRCPAGYICQPTDLPGIGACH